MNRAISCNAPSSIPAEGLQGCAVAAVSHHGTWRAQIECKVVVSAAARQFSLKTAKKCTATMPCTNVPVKCPECNYWDWSYNMEAHCQEKHNCSPSTALSSEWAPRIHEKAWLRPYLDFAAPSSSQKPRACRIDNCPCKNGL